MKKQLYDYQSYAIKKIVERWQSGNRKVVFQLPTGGGKTLTAVELIHHFSSANPGKEVIFLVHRLELLAQFKNAYEKQHEGVEVGIINADTKHKRLDLKIFVGMVETVYNRLSRDKNYLGDKTGLVIIDECHISNFDKILPMFQKSAILGLSATPTRLGRKNPLKKHYEDLVSVITIKELIEKGALAPNRTYNYESKINYKNVKKVGGDFNAKHLALELSKSVHIQNVIKAYEQVSLGKKTIVFNSTIEHSEVVNKAFLEAGYNSKHLDSTTDEHERRKILEWFSKTPDAILQNVAILTTGFDEPTIQTVIMNRRTMSIPLWLQCCGRGSRICAGKEYFTIIDLGGNAERLGDWSHDHDWHDLFFNATEKNKNGLGIAPVRTCEKCSAILPIQTKICDFCGHVKETEEAKADEEEVNLKLFVDNLENNINLYKIDNFIKKKKWRRETAIKLITDQFYRELKKINKTYDYSTEPILISIAQEWARKNKVDEEMAVKTVIRHIKNKNINAKTI